MHKTSDNSITSLKHDKLNKKNSDIFKENNLTYTEQLDLSFLKSKSFPHIDKSQQMLPGEVVKNAVTLNSIQFTFNKAIYVKLHKLSDFITVSPHRYAHSILAFLLYKYSGQAHFCLNYGVITDSKNERDRLKDAYITSYDFSKAYTIVEIIDQLKISLIALEQKNEKLHVSPSNVSFVHIDSQDSVFNVEDRFSFKNNFGNLFPFSEIIFTQHIEKENIHYHILYCLDTINPTLLQAFVACYQRLFVEILDDLIQVNSLKYVPPLKSYALLSKDKYKEMVYGWNATDQIPIREKTIATLFEEQAKQKPENIALIYQKNQLTYQELNERANQLANYLKQTYRLVADTPISLCLEKDEHMFISLLAALKAGGVYIPINLDYPDDRIQYILEDTKTHLILTNQNGKARLEGIIKALTGGKQASETNKHIHIIEVDNCDFQDQLALQSKENPDSSLVKSENLAYVIYTSGTTGKPKGVMIAHKAFIATMDCMKTLYFADEKEINTYNITHYAFDMIGPEYGLPLLTGGSICIGNNEFTFLDCSNYDFVQITPSLCDLKLDGLINTNNTKLFIGAESVNRDLLVRVLNKSIDVVHLYGPTETTVWSTHQYYSSKENTAHVSVILGKPFYNESVYVLDQEYAPLPVGAIGELYIGGVGLARGYFNRPALTAEKFVPNPFQTLEEKLNNKNLRLYRTGDLVRWLPDGHLEYIGRNDFQVKIRGYRIELGDIEAVLSSYAGIKQSVAMAKERISNNGSPTGQKYLVAYYVSDYDIKTQVILQHVKNHLPDYMVPNFLIKLPQLPLTINGKLDRNSLPEPEWVGSEDVQLPRNKEEFQLWEIWAEVLGLSKEHANIVDDFFMLGGDSILAIRLVGKINQECKSFIKVKDLYEAGCILNLIKIIHATKDNKDQGLYSYQPFSLLKESDYPKTLPDIDLIEDIYPASQLQIKMLGDFKKDQNGAYHIVSNYSVKARFEKNKLIPIIEEIIHKYELLRAAFFLDKEANYVIAIYRSINLEYCVYENVNSKELIAKEKTNNFDYSKPGLFRLMINDLGESFDLIFSIHHAIEDGWSMALLINDFGKAYINNQKIEVNVKSGYGEFIRNEINSYNQENINFWQAYLKDSPQVNTEWRLDNKKPGSNLLSCFFSLKSEEVFLTHTLSKKLKIGLDSIFLLIYLKTLFYFVEEPDMVVGVVTNNRLESEDGDKLFGLFIDIMPFRFNLKNDSDDVDRLLSVFNTKMKLQSYKSTPSEYLKTLYRRDLYQFVFNFVHLHILSNCVKEIESIDGYERTAIPFSLTVAQKGDSIFNVGINTYDDFVDQSFLTHFLEVFKDNLLTIIKLV